MSLLAENLLAAGFAESTQFLALVSSFGIPHFAFLEAQIGKILDIVDQSQNPLPSRYRIGSEPIHGKLLFLQGRKKIDINKQKRFFFYTKGVLSYYLGSV